MYGLYQHILNRLRPNPIQTKFEIFYQGLLRNTQYLPESTIGQTKTILPRTCESYSKIRVPCKYEQVTNNLFKDNNIVIMKQNKGS